MLCAQRKITMIKWMWGEESGWIIWPCVFIKQHWPLVKLVRIIQRVICIMLVCMRVWIHLSMRIMKLCAIFLYECVSVAGCVCICVFFMCVCVHTACMGPCAFTRPHMYNRNTLDLSTESVYSVWGVCVSVCVCVRSYNGAWWTGASFDAMKADRRETGPIRRVGAAN